MTPPTGSRSEPPGDLELLRDWLPLARRLRKAAKDGGHCAVLSCRVIVDADGTPRHWTEPERVAFEPRAGSDELSKLIDLLAGSKEDGRGASKTRRLAVAKDGPNAAER